MDARQDQAHIHLLVLSPAYLSSPYCRHEMQRAVAVDPDFTQGCVLPVVREACTLPPEIHVPEPLHVKLIDDTRPDQWDLLTERCRIDLGTSAAEWLRARDQVRDAMLDGRSVNLVVLGSPERERLLAQLKEDLGELAIVDLDSGATVGRQNLITEILRELGINGEARRPPNDLDDLHKHLMAARAPVRLAFRHFILNSRVNNYKPDFFSALKHLVDKRKLILLIESRAPYATLLPLANCLSKLQMKTVELRGRTP
jgi:hypothetical protein